VNWVRRAFGRPRDRDSNAATRTPGVRFIEAARESLMMSFQTEPNLPYATKKQMMALTWAASVSAEFVVERFPTLTRLWAGGDEVKAVLLLTAWCSGVSIPYELRGLDAQDVTKEKNYAVAKNAGYWVRHGKAGSAWVEGLTAGG